MFWLESDTYSVLPYTCTAEHITTCRIPVNISDTVMVGCIHVLQVGGQVFLAFGLLAFEIEIPKVEVEALL